MPQGLPLASILTLITHPGAATPELAAPDRPLGLADVNPLADPS